MAETAARAHVDIKDLSKIGMSSEAQKKVSAAFEHFVEVLGEEMGKAPRKEAAKIDLTVKGTYTQKGGAGGEVSVTIHF